MATQNYDESDYPRMLTQRDVSIFQAELDNAAGNDSLYLHTLLRWSYHDPDLFNTMILGRGPYWDRQRDWSNAVANNTTTLVLSGNQVGKSYFLSGGLLWYVYTRPYARVVSTAPTANHLSKVLWNEVRSAHANAPFKLAGKITGSPSEMLLLDDKWDAIGLTSPKKEALSGIHGRHVLVCMDEASGMSPDAWEGLNSLGYDKLVAVGNPVRTDNHFYNLCKKAELPGSRIKLLKISSLESPHINQWKSPWGLACRSWLEDMREQYGESSIWWKSHVLAEWPEQSSASLFLEEWLDLAVDAVHVPGGPIRIAVDYAEGKGGDDAVIAVRDDNGLYELEGSNRWEPDELARRVATFARKHKVQPSRISWDATGTGAGFGHHLEGQGLLGCVPYKGSYATGKNAVGTSFRTCAAWAARLRLDPSREVTLAIPDREMVGPRILWKEGKPQTKRVKQTQFAIPERFMTKLRNELQTLRYEETGVGKIHLETGDAYRDRLGKSPDYSDAFLQSFFWPE